jgi:hypothetical protein
LINLQNKTKDFIINECNTNRSLLKKPNNVLKISKTPKHNNNIKINFNVKRNSNQKVARYSGSEFYQNCILNNFTNTFNNAMNRSFNEENKFHKRGSVKNKKDKFLQFPYKNSDAQNLQKSSSSRSIHKIESLKITNFDNTNNKAKKKNNQEKNTEFKQKIKYYIQKY